MGEKTKIFAKAYLCGPEIRPEDAKDKLRSANSGFMVQAVRADSTSNEFFVEMLAAQTLSAASSGSLLAKKPEIDFLLRLAGTTQISRAIKKEGARAGGVFLLVAAGASEVRDAVGLQGRELLRQELTRKELDRIERAALLDARRP